MTINVLLWGLIDRKTHTWLGLSALAVSACAHTHELAQTMFNNLLDAWTLYSDTECLSLISIMPSHQTTVSAWPPNFLLNSAIFCAAFAAFLAFLMSCFVTTATVALASAAAAAAVALGFPVTVKVTSACTGCTWQVTDRPRSCFYHRKESQYGALLISRLQLG